MSQEKCPFCDKPMTWVNTEPGEVQCPCCGLYYISQDAIKDVLNMSLNSRQKSNISGWLHDNHNFEITTKNFVWLIALPTPSFHEQADKLLMKLEKCTIYAGEYLEINDDWLSGAWCINAQELKEIYEYLLSTDRIIQKAATSTLHFKILPDGWAHLEEIKKINTDSLQCFVAMWFDDKMQTIYDDDISRAITDAGYKPHKVDQREYNGKIDDEIIAQIRRSRFIVADFTGQRGGVYYEAGFAKGLGLEVILTCRKDEIDKLHFDIRQYNCIDWEMEDLEEFSRRLTNRIESIFGRGSYAISE